jgi:hypothetical protein
MRKRPGRPRSAHVGIAGRIDDALGDRPRTLLDAISPPVPWRDWWAKRATRPTAIDLSRVATILGVRLEYLTTGALPMRDDLESRRVHLNAGKEKLAAAMEQAGCSEDAAVVRESRDSLAEARPWWKTRPGRIASGTATSGMIFEVFADSLELYRPPSIPPEQVRAAIAASQKTKD